MRGHPRLQFGPANSVMGEYRPAGAAPIFTDPQDLLDHLESTRIETLAPSR